MADEMGLGKTVMMIGLIHSNPKTEIQEQEKTYFKYSNNDNQ